MKKNTEYFDNILKKSSLKDFDSIVKELPSKKEITFTEYFNKYIFEHDLVLADVIRDSLISKDYAYQLVNGRKKPTKDRVIALCVAAGMSFDEINRALKICNVGTLYSKTERDTAITLCLHNNIKSVDEINAFLYEHNLPILETSKEAKNLQ